MNIQQLLLLTRKYMLLVVAITLLGGGAAYYYVLRQPPTYRASTKLALNPAAPNALVPFSPATTAQSLIPTYVEFLRSDAFAALVVKELNQPDVTEDTILNSVSAAGIPNTLFFRISAVSTRADYAQLFANTVAKVFIEQNTVQQQAQQRASTGQETEAQKLERQNLEDLRQRLQDETNYYKALLPALRQQVTDLDALPASADRDKRIFDLRSQLAQAQDTDARLLASLADVQAKLAPAGSGPPINTAIVVDEARLPIAPEPSRGPLIFGVALLVSFAAAVGLGYLLESLNRTYKTPEMLDAEYGMPTVGAIGVLDLRSGIRKPKEKLVTVYHPNSSAAEAYRSLRTNIQFAGASKPIQTLLVTSAGPAEGKSLTTANVAVTFAQADRSVVLVDLDLRRPSQHHIFEQPNDRGFTNLLLDDQAPLDTCLRQTMVPGLSVLTSGPLPPNPSEILGSSASDAVLEKLKSQFELVIIDSPPAVTVTDAVVLAARVDAVLQVVGAGTTRRDMVLRGHDVLARAGARVIDPVLNRVRSGDMGYYYYYYYYRYYNRGTPRLTEPVPVWRRLVPSRNGHAPSPETPEPAAHDDA
jgi:capsular exopolysaccharide synthesis family protein